MYSAYMALFSVKLRKEIKLQMKNKRELLLKLNKQILQ